MAEACSRLRRVGVLPLPRQNLLRVAAAAGVAVAVYGAACGTLPRDAARRLRASAAWAVSRGGRFGAAELRLLLGDAACRADPAAALALAPLMRLAQALRWRLVAPEDVREVFAAAPGAGGPTRACRRALGVLRLGADPLQWELPDWPGVPQGTWDPASQPLAATLRLLRALWQGGAVRAVAARRLEFAQLRTGIDWLASLRASRRAGWGPARLGALRSVMTGDVVTERRAAHWSGRGPLCPECGEPEDLRHRFWACRAWAQTRTAAAAAHGWTPEGLLEAPPEVTLLTGLVPPAGGGAGGAGGGHRRPASRPPP